MSNDVAALWAPGGIHELRVPKAKQYRTISGADLWTPANSGELVGWAVGYQAGWDHGHREGRQVGYAAGREGFAGELAVALRFAFAGPVLGTETALAVLAAPWPRIRGQHLAELDRVERRRRWDRENRSVAA